LEHSDGTPFLWLGDTWWMGLTTRLDWPDGVAPAPTFIGRREFRNIDLNELTACIDWGPFFQTWDLAGAFPAILDDAVVGAQARQVHADAHAMLKKIIDGRWLSANAVVGLYPANSVGDDDIAIYADARREQPAMTWYGLRQQSERPVVDGVRRPNLALADFVAPRGAGDDHLGLFAVCVAGAEARAQAYVDANDDYSAIMLKALADRLAEACAEWLHRRVRTELWGYAAGEALDNAQLIREEYRGIRPAPGYPACPEHSVKGELFALLDAAAIGMSLTEHWAMLPASSVSGFYLAHPQARYFHVGPVGDDQAEDWQARSGRELRAVPRASRLV